MNIPPELLSFLRQKDDFFIATHINPEGDALGSSLALSIALNAIGKNTVLFDRDGVPEFYRFLPDCEKIMKDYAGVQSLNLSLLLLDCNTPERAGIEGLTFRQSAVIDHHETESDFGDIRWIEPKAAATGLMIFYLIKALGVGISKEMAVNLYTAIAIDTGTFRFGNTTAEVLRVASELADAGAQPAHISGNLYEIWSEARFNLLRMALQTLEIKNKVAFTFVNRRMYRETGAGPEDTENFSSFPRIMKDIRISVFFREIDDDYWKVSLRSKGDINVASVASLFNGGGHKNAAGYFVRAPLKAAKEALLKKLSELI
jgi:bifunctional oligoribonuclease and PAP phosphatase NrnA